LTLILLFVTVVAAQISGCSINRMLARAVADQLTAQAEDQDDDLELVRDAAPFFLKFGESVLARTPDHEGLAEVIAAGFVRYAWAFVAFEADRVESRDSAAATRLRQRAVRLYARAERHAMRALEQHYPGLERWLANPGRQPRGGPGSHSRKVMQKLSRNSQLQFASPACSPPAV
jgi:hypothetical protein